MLTQYNAKKKKLLNKYKGCCCYCGIVLTIEETQIEHFIPRSKGGQSTMNSDNLVPSCKGCNMKKGVKDIESFRIKLFGKKSIQSFYYEKLNIRGEKIY